MLKPALWGPLHQSGWNHTPRELLSAALTTELLKSERHFCQPKPSMEKCDFKTPERSVAEQARYPVAFTHTV